MIEIPAVEQLLGGQTAAEFLRDYWQQKPCLIRKAWTLTESPIEADELAGLACELDNARIIQEQTADGPWQIQQGPFKEASFSKLPERQWTLLVTDMEKHVPELKAFIEPFRFIPDWRIDDLMISYAADGGSVGPHVDEYDVFLLQLQGVREWRVGGFADPADCIPGLPLKILSDFITEESWELQAGDMLYLPPRYAHWGIGRGDNCLTASVGFRAPEPRDLVHGWVDQWAEQLTDNAPTRDTLKQLQPHSAEITADTIQNFRDEILQRIKPEGEVFQRWLGSYLTEACHADAADFDYQPNEPELLKAIALLQQPGTLFTKNPFSHFAFSSIEETLYLYVDGSAWKLALEDKLAVTLLTEHTSFSSDALIPLFNDTLVETLAHLLIADAILLAEDD